MICLSSIFDMSGLFNISNYFSETRFVEVMEHVCKKFDSDKPDQFDSLKDLQFKVSNSSSSYSFNFSATIWQRTTKNFLKNGSLNDRTQIRISLNTCASMN